MKPFLVQDKDLFMMLNAMFVDGMWPLLLTWFNFNPAMDK